MLPPVCVDSTLQPVTQDFTLADSSKKQEKKGDSKSSLKQQQQSQHYCAWI